MSTRDMRYFLGRHIPLIGNLVSPWKNWRRKRAIPCYRQMSGARARPNLLPYPIDMYPLLTSPCGTPDEAGVLCNPLSAARRAVYHPTMISQYALAHWNAYLVDGSDEHKKAFMSQASWLADHELHLPGGAGGWPIPCASPAYHAPRPWLSATTQGSVISVLVRAYQLNDEVEFLQAARRAVRTFELDILDGGVNTTFGDDGVFFEDVAVYPAAHILSGHVLGLLGLYDYAIPTKDSEVEALLKRSVASLHTLLDAFDTGYWTRHDLLHKRLANWFDHSLHITLLEALAQYSGCGHCAALAARWAAYQSRVSCHLRYLVASRVATYFDRRLKPGLRRLAFRSSDTMRQIPLERVCIPITGFPISGGMRSVLATVAQAMGDLWQMTYLTQYKGQRAEGLEIETFGRKAMHPWQFPNVLLYSLTGWVRLFTLLRQGSPYHLILPQDGVFTGAFAALVGKMAGVRVVCMDHGNMTWLDDPVRRREQMDAFKVYPLHRQIFSRLRLACYWPSLRLLALIATRSADQFLVAGDEVEAIYRKNFGVHAHRIVRYAYMIDVTRFTPPDNTQRINTRLEQGFPEEAIVIAMVNRLAPEKGMPVALEGIALALSVLPREVKTRVQVLIVGDGPLRAQVEADIRKHRLEATCILWGEAKPSDVVKLLGISDIFLYSGTRGSNYSVAVLEAMAAGCAVVGSVPPLSNVKLLAEGRGIAIASNDTMAIGTALARLCSDLGLCREMGQRARNYIAQNHTTSMLQRSLLRVSFFAPALLEVE